jgi:hypothetical protein
MNKDYPDRFDFISLAHVLEHIPDPIQYLRNLREKWLTGDGNLLVEVPNLYGHDCFEIAHLISYSVHTLKQTLQQAGYEIRVTQVHGMPRSRILHLYITILAKPSTIPKYSSTPSLVNLIPERNVKLKRRLGFLKRQILTRLLPRKAWLAANHK